MAWKLRVSVMIEIARRPPVEASLIDFFDQSALNKLTGDFCHAGGSKLALFSNLYARDWTVLVNQAINCRTVELFNEVNVTDLSLSARCHTFTYSVTTSLPLTMVLVIL